MTNPINLDPKARRVEAEAFVVAVDAAERRSRPGDQGKLSYDMVS